MIQIKRTKAPEIFTKKDNPSVKEIKEAEAFFAKKINANGKFEFGFYSTYKDSYKPDLVKNFNFRCAYCETLVLDNSRGDIEHFRPKGEFERIDGKKARPGYYWLAADWKNLYLSCTLCNQATTLTIIDAENPAKAIKKKVGKMNNFGLSNEKYRCNDHRKNIAKEEPYRLLLDPCKDNPEMYLEYLQNGVIKPKKTDQKKIAKAEYSILTYGLQRLILVKKRSEKYKMVSDKIDFIDAYSDNIIAKYKSGKDKASMATDKKFVDSEFNNLIEFLVVDKEVNEFIALSRQLIHPFLIKYLDKLSTFLKKKNTAYFSEARDYFLPHIQKINNQL